MTRLLLVLILAAIVLERLRRARALDAHDRDELLREMAYYRSWPSTAFARLDDIETTSSDPYIEALRITARVA